MPIYSSDSDSNEFSLSFGSLFGRKRPLYAVLGGGKVTDVLLWRNKNVSAAILVMVTVIWLLFEVAEYHFVTLLCHISIISMLIVFTWSNGAALFNWRSPNIPEIVSSESTFKQVASILHAKITALTDIACGKDLTLFLLVIVSLWIFSVIGTCFSSLNLLYLSYICMATLPALYEKYEEEVDYFASKRSQDLKKLYRKFDSKVLNKIPRGPVKEKKFK